MSYGSMLKTKSKTNSLEEEEINNYLQEQEGKLLPYNTCTTHIQKNTCQCDRAVPRPRKKTRW